MTARAHLHSVPGGQECARPLPAGRTHPSRAADQLVAALADGVQSHCVAADGAVTVTFAPDAAPAARALLVAAARAACRADTTTESRDR